MTLVPHECPQCSAVERVHDAATEVTHLCPAKRDQVGRPTRVTMRRAALVPRPQSRGTNNRRHNHVR